MIGKIYKKSIIFASILQIISLIISCQAFIN